MDGILKLISGLGIPPWMLIAIVAFFFLRQTKPGGNTMDGILDILRRLFKRPAPDAPAETWNLDDTHDCCECVIDLASHLHKAGHTEEASVLRAMLPKIAEGCDHAEAG